MPDHLDQALRYRKRAAECESLADLSQSQEAKRHFRTIAGHYLSLAEAEEILAKTKSLLKGADFGSVYRSRRSPHWLKVENPKAPAVMREADEDWGAE
jgi:hypothetical protein